MVWILVILLVISASANMSHSARINELEKYIRDMEDDHFLDGRSDETIGMDLYNEWEDKYKE